MAIGCLETHRHVLQMQLLMDSLRAYLVGRRDAFVGGNTVVYFSLEQMRNQDFRGPTAGSRGPTASQGVRGSAHPLSGTFWRRTRMSHLQRDMLCTWTPRTHN